MKHKIQFLAIIEMTVNVKKNQEPLDVAQEKLDAYRDANSDSGITIFRTRLGDDYLSEDLITHGFSDLT